MYHTTSAQRTFEALHQVEGSTLCGRLHGHSWTVSVTVSGGLDPKKIHVVDHGELLGALSGVVSELAERDLNAMLPGVVTTPEGVALYIRERLILDWPRIVNVTVQMGQFIRVSVEGDVR